MPRTIRIQYPGATYHVYSRGNEKRVIFKDDYDRQKFIDILAKVKSKIDFDIFAYVLMPNHYHILLSTPSENLGKIMQLINTPYSVYFNWKYKRVGYLCQSRYCSIIVADDSYFIKLTKYIHLNPMGTKREEKLGAYPWSSLREYLGRKGHRLAEPERALRMFDESPAKARDRYTAYLLEGGNLSEEEVKQDMFSCMIIGPEELSRKVYDKFKKIYKGVPKKMLRSNRFKPDKIMETTASTFDVAISELIRKKGKSNFARKAAVYLLFKHTALTYGEIAVLFGNAHQSNITRAIKSAEMELKTNTDFSTLVSLTETGLSQK